ncbi:MAG TPA: DUF2723 domain-containing protein, partial [bacterium]|nr:DUF2723 domain-containing protein [bacterium]
MVRMAEAAGTGPGGDSNSGTSAKNYWSWAAIVFIAGLALYISTAAPDFLFDDNSEFISSSYYLGVTHPPGYPLISLMGKFFTFALPGTAGLAVNLVSAFAGAGAIALIFILLIRALSWLPSALIGAGAAAVSRLAWEQAGQADVYPLNLFFFTLALNIAWSLDGSRKDLRRVLALVLVLALGVINHYSMTLAAPVFAVYVIWLHRGRAENLKKLAAPAALIVAAACSVWFYLPFRSAASPVIRWNDQTTVSGFANHIVGVDRRSNAPLVPVKDKVMFIFDYAKRLWRERSPFLLLLLPFGVWSAWALHGTRGRLLLYLWVVMFAGFTLILNYLYGPRSSFVVKVFHITSLQTLAILTGFGADVVLKKIKSLGLPWSAPAAIAAALLAVSLVLNLQTTNLSSDLFAPKYGKNLLATIERDGVLFSNLETESFPVSNLRAVHGVRRDITLFGRQGDIDESSFKEGRYTPLDDSVKKIGDLINFTVGHSGDSRKIYFTSRLSFGGAPGAMMRVNGLVYELNPLADKLFRTDPWSKIDTSGINYDEKDRYDYILKSVLTRYLVMRGEYYLEGGFTERARDYFTRAGDFNPESRFLHATLGGIYLRIGDVETARSEYEKGLQADPENVEFGLDTAAIYSNLSFIYGKRGEKELALEYMEMAARGAPNNPMMRFNLGNTYYQNDMCKEAIVELEEAVKLGLKNAVQHQVLGVCYEKTGNAARAEKNYETALKLDPRMPEAYRDYGVFSAYVTEKPELAAELLKKYLELDPNPPDKAQIEATVGLFDYKFGKYSEAASELALAIKATVISITAIKC